MKDEEVLKKLIDTLNEWIDDLRSERDDYKKLMRVLDKAAETFESEKKSFLVKTLPWAMPFLTVLSVCLFLFISTQIVKSLPCGTSVEFDKLKIITPCPK